MVVCPLCQKIYQPENAQVLELSIPASLVHSDCPCCGNTILAIVVNSLIGKSSVNMITDWNFEDVLKFTKQRNITSDEMLEIHQELRQLKSIKFFFKEKKCRQVLL